VADSERGEADPGLLLFLLGALVAVLAVAGVFALIEEASHG
jgi:hypothetical protein